MNLRPLGRTGLRVSEIGFGAWGIGTMLLFLSILSLGWVYAYRERILEWH